jgi:hypothetical protein
MSHEPFITEVVIPALPRAEREITQTYVNKLVNALETAIAVLNSTRQRNFTEISLTNTQEHGGNLRVGTVFSDGGTLKIVRAGDVYVGTLAGTGAVGTVTVSTP